MEDKQLDDVGAMPPGSQSYAAAPQRRARSGSTCVGAARRGELVDRGAWPASWRADAPGGRAGELTSRTHLSPHLATSPTTTRNYLICDVTILSRIK
jgi:hypothetical protein